MNTAELSQLLEPVRAAVKEAGDRARRSWGAVTPEVKADETFVTEVDRRTEDFLAERLATLLPSSVFAGEERGRRGTDEDGSVWVCDPIDGTTNFVKGLPHWCVSVGLLHRGTPALGVVYAPVLGTMYWGVCGAGAWRDGARIHSVSPDRLAHEDLLCASTGGIQRVCVEKLPTRIRCIGSIALELCLVAEGRAVAAIGCGEGIADLAASLCLCAEAGASATSMDGAPLAVPELLAGWRTREPFLVASDPARSLLLPLLTLRPD